MTQPILDLNLSPIETDLLCRYNLVAEQRLPETFLAIRKSLTTKGLTPTHTYHESTTSELLEFGTEKGFKALNVKEHQMPRVPRYFKNFIKFITPIVPEINTTMYSFIKTTRPGQENIDFSVAYFYDNSTKLITYDYASIYDGRYLAYSWNFLPYGQITMPIPLSVLPKKSPEEIEKFLLYSHLSRIKDKNKYRAENNIMGVSYNTAFSLEEVV